jgi:hypothetical protein
MNILGITAVDEIDGLAKEYADARETLAERVQKLKDELAGVSRRHLKGIKAAAAEAALRRSQLEQRIAAAPDLFVKPRTMTLHGIKLGFAKGKGRLEFDDADRAVAAIYKLLPDQADALIITSGRPNKEGLEQLDAGTLKKSTAPTTRSSCGQHPALKKKLLFRIVAAFILAGSFALTAFFTCCVPFMWLWFRLTGRRYTLREVYRSLVGYQ